MEEQDAESLVRAECAKTNVTDETWIQMTVRLIEAERRNNKQMSDALTSMQHNLNSCMKSKLELETKARLPRNM
jgi:hypothetical protein